ncbi:two-component system sensor histidine kinase DegS [Desulfohalotomaculum tongense]|uniref:sensor histidine kinase n=1 Tax=Desulforadius tongensis TaxID=1216062 RepID=UPI00195EFB7F|nr:sensor histidine kinase [Desulforadius tongensis]MBM7855613.1 two-component system sensor histidine kinase DegS [Desulforadius tongensis]
MLDISVLDKVINKTVNTLEKSKEEIYQISESARTEYERVKRELARTKEKTAAIILKVDKTQREFYKARLQLMKVDRDFKQYNEEEIKEAYNQAHKKQLQLLELQEQEKMLRLHRDYLERHLITIKKTIQRSEELISNMTMAMRFLTNDLETLSSQIGEIQQMHAMGLSIIKAQEEERKRVAREIHDGPAQSMANIVMRTEFCLKLLEKDPTKVQHELHCLMDLVRKSLKDVRKIIFDLRPMVLDDLGLVPAIKRYIEQYSKDYDIYVETKVIGRERRLDSAVEVALFRVIQESLANIKKHAQANQVMIKIEFLPEKINIAVRDNGRGFDKNKILSEKNRKGFGLLGMRERIQLLKGSFKIKTAPGRGTEILLSVAAKND